ncbi:hypothetical protein F6W70_09095 [Microbacterium maritypicum]|uniref:Uncharacterized protein n=1 Tax=Microbacterium maritypicum TaxID=33918 RepID=A0AAD3X5P3_MICMQ|nr:hypothetical protein [Microbacterium liquefaciens]KAB1887517.1 hypothetical protein F6W70_09095 [Microbacterium liquefaciens]
MPTGRISLLVDSPLRDLLIALRAVPAEARKSVTTYMRKEAEPIWFEETRDRATTRLQQRALVNTARVGVATRNIYLRSGGVGKLSSGTPVPTVAFGAEFGGNPDKQIEQRSRKGKPYKRRLGNVFGAPRRGGNVVYPAARASIPRIASVAIQSAYRALLDAFDGKQ